jgi:hypothetical protein
METVAALKHGQFLWDYASQHLRIHHHHLLEDTQLNISLLLHAKMLWYGEKHKLDNAVKALLREG